MLRMPSGALMKSLFVGAPAGGRTLTYFTREGGGGCRGISLRQQPQQPRGRGLRTRVRGDCNAKAGATRIDSPVNYFVALRNMGCRPATSISAGEPKRSRGPTVDTSSPMQRKPFRPSTRSRPAVEQVPPAIEGKGMDAPSVQRKPLRPSPPSPPRAPSSVEQLPPIDVKEMDASSVQKKPSRPSPEPFRPSTSPEPFRPSTSPAPFRPSLSAPAPAPAAVEQAPPKAPPIEVKEMDELMAVATKVADASGDIIRTLFRTKMDVSDMDDENPMTVAESTAEYAMSMLISQHFPTHAMYTEDSGLQMQDDNTDFIWVMDPIYGADSFMSGKPLFGTLLSLVHKGIPILGIIDQPILRERWIGRIGKETTLNGEPVATRSSTKTLKDAYMFATSPHLFPASKFEIFNCVRDKVKVPQYGGDCYAYGLLATGHVDVVLESGLKPYDFLALIPVIEGAGGYITDWQGQKLTFSLKSVDDHGGTEVLAAGSEAVHKGALAALAEGKK